MGHVGAELDCWQWTRYAKTNFTFRDDIINSNNSNMYGAYRSLAKLLATMDFSNATKTLRNVTAFMRST